MKRILLAASLATMAVQPQAGAWAQTQVQDQTHTQPQILAQAASATSSPAARRDFPIVIKPGLAAVISLGNGDTQQASVRVGDGPLQPLATFDDDTVDQVQAVDINHDGYRDLILGQSGGSTQLFARLFLYQPDRRGYQEIAHPDNASPCKGFVNPVIDDKQPVIHVACRYGAASNGFEDYVLRPDGTVRATSWGTQALFALESEAAELTYRFREDGAIDRIDIEGEGSPLEGGTVPVSRLDLYDTPDVNARPGTTAAEGEHLDVVALRPPEWLQVRYADKTAGTVLKWVRYGDLRVDKHRLATPSPKDRLTLELADTLADWNGEDGGQFMVSVANHGDGPVALNAPRVWLLLTNAQGERIVHPLYQREGDTLHPANPLGLARDPVVWAAGEDGKPTYQVNDNGYSSVPFLPALAPGKYRAAAVLTDPGNLAAPIVSNDVRFDYPLPKRPPAAQ
ncbi:MAG: SH3 domain-containing protein [Achromobacter sp.]|uniref:XAC2610-related protein n=1 Tax=Achromobacter sp. TaxID=134375 RepID=UPI0029A9302B|nr:SH3 domain-containing protein [Achromobacter sp.]MDX3988201.1 SH3 domain-containing protein [Achromobacter sp.]